MSQYKQFVPITDDEFFAYTYDLGDTFGTVSDVTVSTDSGRIIRVVFRDTDKTRMGKLREYIKEKELIKVGHPMIPSNMDAYQTKDSAVSLMLFDHREPDFRKRGNRYEITYANKISHERERREMEKTIGAFHSVQAMPATANPPSGN